MGGRWTLVAIVALLASAPLAHGQGDAQFLERNRPLLRYDADETSFAQPVARPVRELDRDLVYGHLVERGGTTWLQYWLFYSYNSQDRGILATGRHEGDWELIQVRLGPGNEARRVTFAQHSTAETCGIDEIETAAGGAPVVYVANGSHASYPRAGTADRPWPDPNDEAGGDGDEVRPPVEVIDDDRPAWVSDERPWGTSEAGPFPGEQSSPPGPMFQLGDRWSNPAALDRAARSCGSDPPGRPWQTPALATIAALVLGGALFRRHRKQRTEP